VKWIIDFLLALDARRTRKDARRDKTEGQCCDYSMVSGLRARAISTAGLDLVSVRL